MSDHSLSTPDEPVKQARVAGVILVLFVLAAACGSGMAVAYWTTGNIAVEGGTLGAALLLAATGLILWAHHLLPEGPYYEEYPDMQAPPRKEATVLATLDRGGIGRRKVLLGTLGAFGLTVGASLLSTIRSFGSSPAVSLSHTPWRDKRILVDSDGRPLKVGDLEVGGEITVFPQGFMEQPLVPAMLIQLPAGANHPLPGRADWAPYNLVCYSKVCSHAGCPVNLYDAKTLDMECPCHQSTFDVTRGARVVFGPAGGPLAQLPLTVDPDGTLRSGGDFSFPPGPVFWHYSGNQPN